MRKLSLTLLAASTMLIAGVAAAQPAPGARPGATWRGNMPRPNVQMRGPNMQVRGNVRTGGGFQAQGGNVRFRGGGNFGFHRWGPHPGRNFRHQRLRRGGNIHFFWFAPQFHVGNWQAYGFHAPGENQRWVRYYDDAYLIDGYGRVIDERNGVDWSRHGEDWADYDGIPGYRGEWSEHSEHYAEGGHDEHSGYREHHAEMRGGHHGGHGPMMPPPPGYGPPPPGHGATTHVYGGGYGYGMYAYPIVIETITTTGSSGYTEEIVEEYVEVRQRRRARARRPRPRCACAPAPRPAVRRPAPRRPAPPRPRPGERG